MDLNNLIAKDFSRSKWFCDFAIGGKPAGLLLHIRYLGNKELVSRVRSGESDSVIICAVVKDWKLRTSDLPHLVLTEGDLPDGEIPFSVEHLLVLLESVTGLSAFILSMALDPFNFRSEGDLKNLGCGESGNSLHKSSHVPSA